MIQVLCLNRLTCPFQNRSSVLAPIRSNSKQFVPQTGLYTTVLKRAKAPRTDHHVDTCFGEMRIHACFNSLTKKKKTAVPARQNTKRHKNTVPAITGNLTVSRIRVAVAVIKVDTYNNYFRTNRSLVRIITVTKKIKTVWYDFDD